jgi:hypothetical protein
MKILSGLSPKEVTLVNLPESTTIWKTFCAVNVELKYGNVPPYSKRSKYFVLFASHDEINLLTSNSGVKASTALFGYCQTLLR